MINSKAEINNQLNTNNKIIKLIKDILQSTCLSLTNDCVENCWDSPEVIVDQALIKIKLAIQNLQKTDNRVEDNNIVINKICVTGEYKLDLKQKKLQIYIYYDDSDSEIINFECNKANN